MSDGIKYPAGLFEEEEFKKYYETGGREQLQKAVVQDAPGRPKTKNKNKWGHL